MSYRRPQPNKMRLDDLLSKSKNDTIHSNSSTPRNGNTTMNNTQSDNSQPVWVKTSILEKYQQDELGNAAMMDDDLSISTTGSTSSRRFTNSSFRSKRSRSSNGSTRSLGPNGWGWVFGYAKAGEDQSTNGHTATSSSPPSPSPSPPPPPQKASPFGQYQLKRSPRAKSPPPPPPPQAQSSPSITSFEQSASKQITIQDEWNTKYNNITITLSAEEVSQNVLLANNTTDIQCDENGNRKRQQPPKNLIELTHLHEPSLIQSLRYRYDDGKVYTFCGSILLALNPFMEIEGLYSEERMKEYWSGGSDRVSDDEEGSRKDVEPHAYAVAHEAFCAMKRAFDDAKGFKSGDICTDQSILVSGESGAGKTVTTKIVMRYLAGLSKQAMIASPAAQSRKKIDSPKQRFGLNSASSGSNNNSMEQQVLQSNPVLESFGNARTVRNDNSSRFGKFIEIQFDSEGCLMGASVKTYLLEKVRLIQQAEGERNYHIFYELLSGLKPRDDGERSELGLKGWGLKDFRMTASSGTFDRRDGVKDADTFRDLRSAMTTVGFSRDEEREILQLVSGLLHMSNLTFSEVQADAVMLEKSNPSLQYVLSLFGVNLDSLNDALCSRTITVGNEVMKKNLNFGKAERALEAVMKATYGALFDHIVEKINNSITVGRARLDEDNSTHHSKDFAFIKILDIFGFESFQFNSFEQLCINYCNEALQQQFNKFVFKLEQDEYERENIAWSFISFPDNQDVLDLIEKKHTGIFSILDEQCKLERCTDQSFANVTYGKCDEHERFSANRSQKAAGSFCIHHYAGPVEYSSSSFLDKNKDELPKEATDFLLSSSTLLVTNLGDSLRKRNSGSDRPQKNRSIQRPKKSLGNVSVGSQFALQLRQLRESIDKTAPHYIRCLKPNDELTPNNFVSAIIADQLRCAGVLEAVRVSRLGYPQRYLKDLFVRRYWILGARVLEKIRNRDVCEALVDHVVPQMWERQNMISSRDQNKSKLVQSASYDLVSVGIQLGKTKVFLRHHAFDALEYLRDKKLNHAATQIQSVFRMFSQKSFYEYTWYSICVIQSSYRRYLARKRVVAIRQSKAVVKIQSVRRGYISYSNYSLILFVTIWCQRRFRGNIARTRYQTIQKNTKAGVIQRWYRMKKDHNYYKAQQNVALNIQQLFRSKKARKILKQLKMDANNLSHVLSERNELKRIKNQLEAENRRLGEEQSQRIAAGTKKQVQQESQKELEDLRRDSKEMARELEHLIRENAEKDRELAKLREEIAILRENERNQSWGLIQESASKNLLDNENDRSKLCTTSVTDVTDPNDSWSLGISQANQTDTPIHLAIRDADDDALSIALTNCDDIAFDINRCGHDGRTPLHLAVTRSNLSSIQFLLQNHSVANAQDNDGNTALHYAESASLVKLLLEDGAANPNIPNVDGFSALHIAVQRRDVDSVKLLLQHNADVNVADHKKWLTPLHLVAQHRATDINDIENSSPVIEIARLLCETKVPDRADVNYQDKDGNTPLHHSTLLGSPVSADLISLFLKYGGKPNLKNERGQSPMHLLLHNSTLRKLGNFHEIIHLMLHHGGDTNITSFTGCTPLHLALYHQDLDSAIQLIENGAQLHLPWTKPKQWESYWTQDSRREVFCLDMVEDRENLSRILSAVSSAQISAPSRSRCMLCKKRIGKFGRHHNCGHCGTLVCNQCSPNKLNVSSFPPYCKMSQNKNEPEHVCHICEQILTTRKHEQSMMGREVTIHGQEDVSFLDTDQSFQSLGNNLLGLSSQSRVNI